MCNRQERNTWARHDNSPTRKCATADTERAQHIARPRARPIARNDPWQNVIPQAELAVIVDMPAELLRRRPDVRSAELQLAAQSALIGVSVADLYPSISLLGSVGLSATSLSGSSRAFTGPSA